MNILEQVLPQIVVTPSTMRHKILNITFTRNIGLSILACFARPSSTFSSSSPPLRRSRLSVLAGEFQDGGGDLASSQCATAAPCWRVTCGQSALFSHPCWNNMLSLLLLVLWAASKGWEASTARGRMQGNESSTVWGKSSSYSSIWRVGTGNHTSIGRREHPIGIKPILSWGS